MTPKTLLLLARTILTHDELNVWVAKHYQHKGRRAGSLMLGITEDAWRYRLRNAEQKLDHALRQEDAA